MKILGDLNMEQNILKNVALEEVTSFPSEPVIGEFCFKDKIVYIYSIVSGSEDGVWIPLTNTLVSYVHVQSVASTSWTVNHDLGLDVVVSVTDIDNNVIIPKSIVNTSYNTTIVSFRGEQQGKAICIGADSSGGIHTATAHNHEQTVEATEWVVDHELGYYPLVQVVLSDLFQIIPSSIEHPTKERTVINFSSPQSGWARLI